MDAAATACIFKRANGNGLGPGPVPFDPVTWPTMAALTAICYWNCIEIVIQIISTFRRRTGLYFWSFVVGAIGTSIQNTGGLLKFFIPDLHFAFYTTVIIVDYWLPRWGYMERIQLCGILVQEMVMSVIYIFATAKILKPSFSVQVRMVVKYLIITNLFIIMLDIVVIYMEFSDFYAIQGTLKPCAYSIKFKLEFAFLNQLMYIAGHGLATRNQPHGGEANVDRAGSGDPKSAADSDLTAFSGMNGKGKPSHFAQMGNMTKQQSSPFAMAAEQTESGAQVPTPSNLTGDRSQQTTLTNRENPTSASQGEPGRFHATNTTADLEPVGSTFGGFMIGSLLGPRAGEAALAKGNQPPSSKLNNHKRNFNPFKKAVEKNNAQTEDQAKRNNEQSGDQLEAAPKIFSARLPVEKQPWPQPQSQLQPQRQHQSQQLTRLYSDFGDPDTTEADAAATPRRSSLDVETSTEQDDELVDRMASDGLVNYRSASKTQNQPQAFHHLHPQSSSRAQPAPNAELDRSAHNNEYTRYVEGTAGARASLDSEARNAAKVLNNLDTDDEAGVGSAAPLFSRRRHSVVEFGDDGTDVNGWDNDPTVFEMNKKRHAERGWFDP
ncbi:MAG: hypothetical protein M1833_001748 [Piccolia ochrophora]|nr:MAG: hypothetical protein M1833_001748 [Piccolia ochrophora]